MIDRLAVSAHAFAVVHPVGYYCAPAAAQWHTVHDLGQGTPVRQRRPAMSTTEKGLVVAQGWVSMTFASSTVQEALYRFRCLYKYAALASTLLEHITLARNEQAPKVQRQGITAGRGLTTLFMRC